MAGPMEPRVDGDRRTGGRHCDDVLADLDLMRPMPELTGQALDPGE
jgi:hypothetical protein